MTREQIQDKGKEAYLSTNGIATVMMGTGGGKSKVAIEIVKELNPPDILFLSNSERGRDITFRDEFRKWGIEALWNERVIAECYQTAYKWEGKHFPFVIADEIDFAMTEEFVKFFKNNTYDRLLGLTGFATYEKRQMLNEMAPICYEISTQDLQKLGILNDTQFFRVEFDLNMVDKNIKVEYGPKNDRKSFYQTENDAYVYLQKQYIKEISILNTTEQQMHELRLLPQTAEIVGALSEQEVQSKRASMRMKRIANERKKLLWTLDSSRRIASKIAAKEYEEGNKILIFSKWTQQIDAICTHTYHSKNSKNNTNIDKLNRGEIQILGVCESINRGENLEGVNVLIRESYDGSETAFQQKHGRGTRLDKDDIMRYYILLPYFHMPIYLEGQKAPARYARVPTQAAQWAEAMSKSFDLNNIITINANDL